MRRILILLILGGISTGAPAGGGCAAATVAQLAAGDPMTWLVKSVCVDEQNQVLSVDPYNGCPLGIRKIASGDPLPYHNVEQIGYQQRDSFSAQSPTNAQDWIIATYDYQPFNYFNLYDGSDGYDVISLQDGWAGIFNTSDGGGYGQAFYTSNCLLGGGWALFPASGFLKGGKATVPIADAYWEQSDQSYPGQCPSKYSTTTLTSWKHVKGFQFGGVNGNPTKTMDTMISYHGYQSGFGFRHNGHLEVFYLTREYGVTRWEVWTPIQQNPNPTSECAVPATQRYQGETFVVQYCHDWSSTRLPAVLQAAPLWPIPNLNLLANPHFIDANGWASSGGIVAQASVSTASRDTQFSPAGVGYVKLACANQCGANFGTAFYQDLPASDFAASQSYGFGINVRADPAQCGGACDGAIAVLVQQLDAAGALLSQQVAQATVAADNGTGSAPGEADSVYLSAAFISGTTSIDRGAATIRFLISPQSAQSFDVLNAWLGPWAGSGGP